MKNFLLVIGILLLIVSSVACNMAQVAVQSLSGKDSTSAAQITIDSYDHDENINLGTPGTAAAAASAKSQNHSEQPEVSSGDNSVNQEPVAIVETHEGIAILIDLLAAGDAGAIQGWLSDPFVIGYWRSEGVTLTPAEAVVTLNGILSGSSDLTYTTNANNFPDLGQPINMLFGPNANVSHYVYVVGLGSYGQGQAILGVRDNGDNTLTWVNMIYAANGFDAAAQMPQPYPVPDDMVADWSMLLNTDVGSAIDWAKHERVFTNTATGEGWTIAFSYPSNWSILELYAGDGYLSLQNDPNPTLDHGIPQASLVKVELVALAEVTPMLDPAFVRDEARWAEAFTTIEIDGHKGILHQFGSTTIEGDIASQQATVVLEIDGQWFIFTGYITVPGADTAEVEMLLQQVLHILSSISITSN